MSSSTNQHGRLSLDAFTFVMVAYPLAKRFKATRFRHSPIYRVLSRDAFLFFFISIVTGMLTIDRFCRRPARPDVDGARSSIANYHWSTGRSEPSEPSIATTVGAYRPPVVRETHQHRAV
ncbi:hypothetical protein JVU11DRAFT_11846 [Chiua virens]|nr:hypothetical protein JVU11DRAFT_11846 [Chiua virens]